MIAAFWNMDEERTIRRKRGLAVRTTASGETDGHEDSIRIVNLRPFIVNGNGYAPSRARRLSEEYA